METTTSKLKSILEKMDCKYIVFETPLKGQMDSIDLTAMVIWIENEFGITITDEERDECTTALDYVALIDSKLIPVEVTNCYTIGYKPTIDDQIKFIEDFVVDPEMNKAIKENLLAVRMQQMVKRAADMHMESSTMSGHSFSEGMGI